MLSSGFPTKFAQSSESWGRAEKELKESLKSADIHTWKELRSGWNAGGRLCLP